MTMTGKHDIVTGLGAADQIGQLPFCFAHGYPHGTLPDVNRLKLDQCLVQINGGLKPVRRVPPDQA